MLSRSTYLKSAKDRSEGKEAFQRRIAEMQRASASAAAGNESVVALSPPDSPGKRISGSRGGRAVRAFYRWFIRFTLVALLVLLVSLILFIWSPSSHPGNAAVVVEEVPHMTAKNANQVAEPFALQWAEDAQLISLSATWDGGQKFQAGEGDWSLLYYSPAKGSTASIVVYDGEATMIATHGVSQIIDAPLGNKWLIDSETAIDLLGTVGGDEFLRAQPEATVTMSLDFSRDVTWRVRFIDQMSRRVFSAQVDIFDGQISNVQQSD
jgi:hypothetical protein